MIYTGLSHSCKSVTAMNPRPCAIAITQPQSFPILSKIQKFKVGQGADPPSQWTIFNKKNF